jgi:transcriptional regulator with XRE-family HTH domain
MDISNKYNSPAYWTQLIQISLYNHIKKYLQDNNLSQSEFAAQLGVSKGYVSQILNGDFDHKLSKLVELAIACNLVPKFEFLPMDEAIDVVEQSYTDSPKKETVVILPTKTVTSSGITYNSRHRCAEKA